MDVEGWGRRWRRVGPGDGLLDGDRNTPFSVFLLLVTPWCTGGGDRYLPCPAVVMTGGRNERGTLCLQSK